MSMSSPHPLSHPLSFKNQSWYFEHVPLQDIAEKYGTPCYVYSKAAIENAYQAFQIPLQHYPHQIHYAVKANSNLSILKVLADLNAGFDIVSLGELERVLKIGGDPKKIIFSGVGKTKEELSRAVDVGVGCVNVESYSELQLLNRIGEKYQKQIPIALRVNPNIDSKSHPYISTGLKENKFGILISQAIDIAKECQQGRFNALRLQGLACHIGSQIMEVTPFITALKTMLEIVDELNQIGVLLSFLNMGGGLGVSYKDNDLPPTPQVYIETLLTSLNEWQ